MKKNHPVINDIEEIVKIFKKDILIINQDKEVELEISKIYSKNDKIHFILTKKN